VLEELRQSLPDMDEDEPALVEQEKRPKRVAKRRAKPTAASLVVSPDPQPQSQQLTSVCLAPDPALDAGTRSRRSPCAEIWPRVTLRVHCKGVQGRPGAKVV
jgi:hypothetical protein